MYTVHNSQHINIYIYYKFVYIVYRYNFYGCCVGSYQHVQYQQITYQEFSMLPVCIEATPWYNPTQHGMILHSMV